MLIDWNARVCVCMHICIRIYFAYIFNFISVGKFLYNIGVEEIA